MKVTTTPNGNIEATFKPHLKSEPVTVFLHLSMPTYFSPSSHGGRFGRLGADDVKRAYDKHISAIDSDTYPEVRVELFAYDDDGSTRRAHIAWDGNPPLIVRGQPVNEARASIKRFPHFEGDGYNHVSWEASGLFEGLTKSESDALSKAFDRILLDAVAEILPSLREGRKKQARESLDEFIRECEEEIKTLKGVK